MTFYFLKLSTKTSGAYEDAVMKKYAIPIIILAVFEAVAITLWLTKDNLSEERECRSSIILQVKNRHTGWIKSNAPNGAQGSFFMDCSGITA